MDRRMDFERRAYHLRRSTLLGLDWESLKRACVMSSPMCEDHREYYKRQPLIYRRLKPRTHAAYQKAVLEVRRLLGDVDFSFSDLDERFAALTTALCEEDGTAGKRGLCEKGMCALIHRAPALKEHMPLSRNALRSWKRIVPPKPEMPLTHEMLKAVHALSWAALLRINETLGLSVADVALPGDARLSDGGSGLAGLRIEKAKTGPNQFATLEDADACQLLAAVYYARTLKAKSRLFTTSYAHVLRSLRIAVSSLGIDASRFGTHSCRVGGALSLSLRGVDSATIALRGR